MTAEAPPPCGILLLDKPLAMSSNAALQRVRWLLGRPKAGHTGSLDPLATGMLPICIGEATKIAGALLAGDKGYTVEVRLGERTDTGDAEGQIVERQSVPPIDALLIASALQALQGPQQQIPPMYSALKFKGQPLYKLARQGVVIERAARTIEIHQLELLGFTADSLRVRVTCSKGTYIRTLAEQLGSQLGTCAHVLALRRDFVEPFRTEPMYTLEQLQQQAASPPLLAADRAVAHLPAVRLSPLQARAMSFGQSISASAADAGQLRLYDPSGRFLGLGMGAAGGAIRPLRLFSTGAARPS
jgi:tRNA pseudouridine55 synthase